MLTMSNLQNEKNDKVEIQRHMPLLEAIVPDFNPDSEETQYIAAMTDALQCYARSRLGQIVLPLIIAERHAKLVKALRAIKPSQGPDRKKMEQDFPESLGYIELLEACLAQYPRILSGEIDPLTVLFPRGSFQLFESIYRDNPPADYFNKIVGEVTARFVARNSGRQLHLLEIGAGTGSTTQFILPRLHKNEVIYTFTDISHAFLSKARERFSEFPFLRYEICDVERDDMGERRYNVIIASNVIHATANLLTTLRNIRRWLIPGGIIILNEITTCQDYMTIAFGLIEGWWRSTDSYRTSGPLVSVETWHSLLRAAGFSLIKGHGSSNQQVLVAYLEDEPEDLSDSDSILNKMDLQIANTPNPREEVLSHDVSKIASTATLNKVMNISQMQWQCFGKGYPLLLLPPLNMKPNVWIQQIAMLERANYSVHIPIYPGHLDNPLEEKIFSFSALIDDLYGYITQNLLGRTVKVVGWSLGGCLALGLARYAPEKIGSLVLISSMAKSSEDLLIRVSGLHDELNTHVDCLEILFKSQGALIEQVHARASAQTLTHYYKMLSSIDFRRDLSNIMIPTLIVHGKQDAVIRTSDVDDLLQLGNARVVEFEMNGHFVPLIAAHRFNALLLNFLNNIDPSCE